MRTLIFDGRPPGSRRLERFLHQAPRKGRGLVRIIIWASLVKLGLLSGGLLAAGIQQVVPS